MKTRNHFPWLGLLMIIQACSLLFAFTTMPGAHSMKVFLDDKLMFDEYVDSKSNAPTLTLDQNGRHSKLIVQYSECGRTVSGRKLTLKDGNDKILTQWKFEGSAKGFEQPMECSVKDIIGLKSKTNGNMRMYYSSNEFPQGHQIINISISADKSTAGR